MSLARRVMERKAQGLQFDFTARKDWLTAGEAASAPVAANDDAAIAAAPASKKPGRPKSPARRHLQRKAASNLDQAQHDGPELTEYQQMQVRLHADRQALKLIQSTELKVEHKRRILPEYAPWVLGRLDAEKEGVRAVQDDVLAHVLVWSIDVGDYALALELAAYSLRNKLSLPERMKRDLATFVVEEVAEAGLKAFRLGGDAAANFPTEFLLHFDALFGEADMPDPVRAKLKKAIGQAILASIEGADGQTAGAQQAALNVLKRAQELDPHSGCVKLIEGLERSIKKSEEPGSS